MPIEKDSNTSQFAKKTYKEVRFWDWLARILPLTVLSTISICYFFKWQTALELVLEITVILFFIICFVWWYWAIYKIAVTVKYLQDSQQKFRSVIRELRSVKKTINNASNRQRRKSKTTNDNQS